MTHWMEKESKRRSKEKTSTHKGYKILSELFSKHNVDFTKEFKITNWSENDKILFEKGMILYGYKHMIKKYL